ncbi:uncharacterized protein B0H18DRAFT_593212 [Fomitopsis serialis]|uniref:uncharacterized protein n=1 Tax=Fomitopsis serialis TaxID=139415 RepID=UPI00200753E9|nr:uncharacterized protein B0H18DRAFT_593212 [Neoantrodia serialis]KAH9920451.1 hypothetical protein B0H18DRAFT_593212 [Neoantrodia serialis]
MNPPGRCACPRTRMPVYYLVYCNSDDASEMHILPVCPHSRLVQLPHLQDTTRHVSRVWRGSPNSGYGSVPHDFPQSAQSIVHLDNIATGTQDMWGGWSIGSPARPASAPPHLVQETVTRNHGITGGWDQADAHLPTSDASRAALVNDFLPAAGLIHPSGEDGLRLRISDGSANQGFDPFTDVERLAGDGGGGAGAPPWIVDRIGFPAFENMGERAAQANVAGAAIPGQDFTGALDSVDQRSAPARPLLDIPPLGTPATDGMQVARNETHPDGLSSATSPISVGEPDAALSFGGLAYLNTHPATSFNCLRPCQGTQ